LEYDSHKICTHSNEYGFTEENVEAVCRIGHSTKAKATREKGFIGEKGIGFKSVFRVASVVHISSRAYSFKFDRALPLGMITPVWADFPSSKQSSGTSMQLQLSSDCDKTTLREEISSFDSNILIFLRRLKEINLSVHSWPRNSVRKLRRIDGQLGSNLKDIKILENGKQIQYYAVYQHTISGMPVEPKRPDSNESDIVMAFPITESDSAGIEQITSYPVFAFLPIRNYGFRVRLPRPLV